MPLAMEKFFSIFGKIALILLILGGVSYGSYYLGNRALLVKKPQSLQTEVPEATASPELKKMTTINGGLNKSAGLSFDSYTLEVPDGWISKKESQTAQDEKLILTKNDYSISIFQAATGGALCLYPGDPDFGGPSSRYQEFKEIKNKDGRILRRSGDVGQIAFTVCMKSADGSYQQPTIYGHISVKLPQNWTKEILDEIDTILSSLRKS